MGNCRRALLNNVGIIMGIEVDAKERQAHVFYARVIAKRENNTSIEGTGLCCSLCWLMGQKNADTDALGLEPASELSLMRYISEKELLIRVSVPAVVYAQAY